MVMPSVQAEENKDFSLDPVIVTALRGESKELDTPANVTVRTGEELKATGAKTVIDALQFVEGITIYSQNPYGQSAGRMSSELVMRGIKKGTLIMVNGAPINMNGMFQLDNILLENVEKIEAVRGPGSVMYGSDAFGGVINIITKNQVKNSITVSSGNKGQQNYNLNLQTGKLAFTSSFVDTGEVNNLTKTATTYDNFLGGEKQSFNATYQFDDKMTLYYTHTEDDLNKERRNLATNNLTELYNDKENLDRFNFQYKNKDWKAMLYGTFRDLDYTTTKVSTGKYSSQVNLKTSKYGLDANKSWDDQQIHYLAGITLEQEKYKNINILDSAKTKGPYDRTVMSAYAQGTKEFNEKQKLILGLRGQNAETESGDEYNQFLPQIQYNQKLGQESSWFVNVGKAFRLPTLTELHTGTTSNFTSNPNLKPESGWTYETGWKKESQSGILKTTLFMMNIDNHIDTDSTDMYQNFSKFKNEGIEVSWQQKLSDKYRYTVGSSYGNPREMDAQGQWVRAYSRIQANMTIGYTLDKLTANLSANYTADRSNKAHNALPVSLMVNYQLKPETAIFATVRNVLNRNDITTNSSNNYYGAPRTVEFGVKHSF
jgi:iron complex outermembrane receptor protein